MYERSLSANEMARMRRVMREVDPAGVFGGGERGLWRGGFKLAGVEEGEGGGEEVVVKKVAEEGKKEL